MRLYGFNVQVLENGVWCKPNTAELIARLKYMTTKDMRASWYGNDVLVCETSSR
jgi:hypothetical protein